MLPLEGVKVLDLSNLLPGPYCTLFLADFGAEVIKIEETTKGDPCRTSAPFIGGVSSVHLLVNRNKKSLTLNLKTEPGKQIFLKLVAKSDVIIEGFRPGVMKRLGLDYEAVSKINPGIIYCSLSGFGKDGPYQNTVGHDINYLGLAGILGISGEKDRPPICPGVQIGDIGGGGMMAIIGILLALQARERNEGRGQYVDIAMLDGLVSWLYIIAGDYFATGKLPHRGVEWTLGGFAFYNVYETRDHKYVSVGAVEAKFWANLCRELGCEEFVPLQYVPEKQDEITAALRKRFLTSTRDEWVARFKDIEICFGPVNTIEEALADPQVRHRGMVKSMKHPKLGEIKQIGIPIKLSATPGQIRSAAVGLGENADEILKGLGYSAKEIAGLRKDGVI